MKESIISILFIGLFNFYNAQTINIPSKLDVSEGREVLDDVERDGFSIELAGSEKEIIKSFEDFLEDRSKNYDIKSFFKKISAENILVAQFSDQHFNLNAQVRESESTIKLWYWVNFGADDFVNSSKYPSEANNCKSLLKEFARTYFTNFINEDVITVSETMEESQENLEDVIDDISDLTKDQLKEKKDREKLEKKKLKLESKLSELEISISEKDADIQQIDADVKLLSTKIKAKEDTQKEIESKIVDQEKTLKELKTKLTSIKNL